VVVVVGTEQTFAPSGETRLATQATSVSTVDRTGSRSPTAPQRAVASRRRNAERSRLPHRAEQRLIVANRGASSIASALQAKRHRP
jgi:hypothetical protein